MELKKNPKLELSKYAALFFSIGLTISMGFVVLIFEWKIEEQGSAVNFEAREPLFEDIIEDIPSTQQTPPPPIVQQPQVIEVPDEEEIDNEIEFDLDIEMTEETIIEELVIEDAPEEEVSDEVFSVVEVMPSFPGGTNEFYTYIANNLRYPSRAMKAEVEGKVILRFVVGINGEISEVEVVKGIGFDCDEEAKRIIQSSPNWLPGQQSGKNVKVRMIVPLNFQLYPS